MAEQVTAELAQAHEAKRLSTADKEVSTPSDASLHSGEEEIDGDYGSYHDHVFKDPKVADYWRNVYEKAHYEGRHRFDPNMTWSATEEKRLRRKVRGW